MEVDSTANAKRKVDPNMSEKAFSVSKALPIVVIAVIVSLAITLPLVYFSPSIFPPLNTQNLADNVITTPKIEDSAIVTAKLADGTITSAKILDGAVTAIDLMDGSIVNIKIADGAVTTSKIADLAVTDTKLASDAIPYFVTYNTSLASTLSTSFVDVPDTAVEVSLNRKSNLIILFNAEAWVDGAGDSLYVRALVNSTVANPDSGAMILLTTAGSSQHGSYAVNFYLKDVDAGVYTVKIQWSEILGASLSHMGDRTLMVIALPA